MEKTIYIYRHGETDLNRNRIVQGSGVDASLNEMGHQQARAFFHYYREVPFEVVLTSALRRTHQTVAPFLELGLPWKQYTELNEMGWGRHEGKVSSLEMREEYHLVVKEWVSGNLKAALGGGESAAEMAARLLRFIEYLKTRPEKTLLVCSHGRAMRCLVCLLKGQPLARMEEIAHSNTGLYQVRFVSNNFEFELENDTTHLSHILRSK